jgi:hypothetical protein
MTSWDHNRKQNSLSLSPSSICEHGIPTQIMPISTVAVARGRRFLPQDYQLGEYDVLCGRGSGGVHHLGNQHFRAMIATTLGRYTSTKLRSEKSSIIYEIVDRVRSLSTNGGGFIKKDLDSGLYYEVGDLLAVSATILHC